MDKIGKYVKKFNRKLESTKQNQVTVQNWKTQYLKWWVYEEIKDDIRKTELVHLKTVQQKVFKLDKEKKIKQSQRNMLDEAQSLNMYDLDTPGRKGKIPEEIMRKEKQYFMR